jgi:uncharacterized membrane protein
MKPRPGRALRALALALLFGGYALGVHWLTASGRPSTAGALLVVVPFMAAVFALAWRSRYRVELLAGWAVLAVGLALNWGALRSSFAWVTLMQHAGVFGLLALAFGRTLASGEVPMISRFAARAHGSLPPPLARYTRQATLAWVLFFGLMCASSLALFASGHIATWSLFANVLTPFLVAAMFGAEYIARHIALPRELRTGLIDSIRAAMQPTP